MLHQVWFLLVHGDVLCVVQCTVDIYNPYEHHLLT